MEGTAVEEAMQPPQSIATVSFHMSARLISGREQAGPLDGLSQRAAQTIFAHALRKPYLSKRKEGLLVNT